MQKKYLYVSIAVILIFVAIVLYYIWSPVYLGFFPIGFITGIGILTQIVIFILSIKNLPEKANRLKTIVTMVLTVLSTIGMSYFFIVWLLVI